MKPKIKYGLDILTKGNPLKRMKSQDKFSNIMDKIKEIEKSVKNKKNEINNTNIVNFLRNFVVRFILSSINIDK